MNVRVSIHYINKGIKEPTLRYQTCNTNQVFIFGGYVKVRESLDTRVVWANTIVNNIDIVTTILPRFENSCMVY